MARSPFFFGWWMPCQDTPIRQRDVYAADGMEKFWYDRKGRCTRHLVARASKPHSDRCWKYVREEGGRARRVAISREEWEERRRPRRGPTTTEYI